MIHFIRSDRSIDRQTVHRLRRRFKATWHRLPALVRDRLRWHWGEHGLAVCLHQDLGPPQDDSGQLIYSRCVEMGRRLCFAAWVMTRLSADQMETLIAHELAHAYEASQGLGLDDEARTDALVERWGFAMQELREAAG
jgi:hypothetical protein